MKLPNPEQAVIDSPKLSGYCLNPEHPDGQNKARVFQSALGLEQEIDYPMVRSRSAFFGDNSRI